MELITYNEKINKLQTQINGINQKQEKQLLILTSIPI